ncbi:MAG: mechanosensitive ion channel [Planctomycetota bacterium]
MKRAYWLATSVVIILAAVLVGPARAAGMPGMERAATSAPATGAQQPAPAQSFQQKYLAEGSPYRGIVVAVLTLIILLVLRGWSTRRLRRYLRDHAYKPENVQKFMRTWKSVWTFGIVVFVLISLSGSLKLLGLSAGFLGMMLGWSLQAPVTGLAAWLMIVTKKPFRIGDRIIIGGVIGDVTDITLTHVILNQVGGTVGGEEKSGRGVLIPNAILFSQTITNYTLDQKFMLDEVPVRVPFEADVERAKEILLRAANEVTKDIIAETGEAPWLRFEFYEAGVLVRLRYQTIPAERQKISSQIVDIILREFKDNYPDVRFGYPHSVVRYRRDEQPEADTPPALQPQD